MPENSVVVNLKAFEQARRGVSADHLSLIHQCRDRLVEGVIRTLARRGEEMERTLIAMADRAPLHETRDTYFSAQELLLRQGTALMAACKSACLDSVDIRLSGSRGAGRGGDTLELALIGDDDYDANLAVDKAAARWRFASAEALVPFDARMGVLLSTPGMPENDNPLGPKALCQALFDGVGKVESQQKVKLVLLDQFDRHLGDALGELYQDLNRLLIEHGILPDLKLGKLKSNPSRGAAVSHGPAQADDGGELFSLFEKLAQSGGGMAGGWSGGAPGGLPGGMGNASAGAFPLAESLGALQQGGVALPGGGRFVLPDVHSVGTENVLRTLQASPVMQNASPLDAVMVDAIALLFDVIFEDSRAPDRLKALIARLQIPVLRVALQDRSLFTDRQHAVRRVLDALARMAPRVPEGQAGDERLQRIETVVDALLGKADSGVEAFAEAATTLGGLETESDQVIESGIAPDIAELAQGEREAIAPVLVHDLVMRALDGQTAPPPLQTFLYEDWAALLRRDYIEGGEDSVELKDDAETLRDLVWSLSPKADTESRLSLVRLLPGLLKKLRVGCTRMELPADKVDRLFSTLVGLHAHAVRPTEATAPAAPVEATAPPPPPPLPAAPQTEAVEQDEFSELAMTLEKGDWLEFDSDDGSVRTVRLGWISRSQTTFLFSDPDGVSSFSASLGRLSSRLRDGTARVVDRSSITESAFERLLKRLRRSRSAA